jgi:hypothetical protein
MRNPCPTKTKECLQEFLTTKDTKYPAWPSAGTKIDSHKGTKTRRRKIDTEMPPKLCGFVAPCENQVFVFQGLTSPSIRNSRKRARFQQVVVRRETGGNEGCATAKYANYAKRARTSSADHVLASGARQSPDSHSGTAQDASLAPFTRVTLRTCGPAAVFPLPARHPSAIILPQRNTPDEAATNELEPDVGRTDMVRPE